jgi:regulator of replication initiation timing
MQSRTSEVTAMKKEMAKLKEDNARLTTENKNVRKELATSQNENKSLTTKLAAARSVPQPEAKTLPGSAMKPRSTGVILPGAAEAAKEAQLKQQKIELYSDLTDLVIVGAKKGEDGEDVYDCLQTGRNGSKPSNSHPVYHANHHVSAPLPALDA